MLKSGFALVLSILTLIMTSPVLQAQTRQGKLEVARCATEMAELFKKDLGVRLSKLDRDTLTKEGESINYRVTLQEKNLYVFVVCGEKSFKNIDIKVYDHEGYLVEKEDKPGNRPTLHFTPPSTGIFIVKVLSSLGKGHYSFISMTK